jgi:hypothetical protein
MKKLLLLDEESEYVSKALDIQDELTIVNSVLTQQKEVLEKMLSFYSKEDASVSSDQRDSRRDPDNWRDKGKSPESQLHLKEKQVHWVDQSVNELQGNEKTNPEYGAKIASTTPNQIFLESRALMTENISIVNKNIIVVEDMIKHAEHVTAEV